MVQAKQLLFAWILWIIMTIPLFPLPCRHSLNTNKNGSLRSEGLGETSRKATRWRESTALGRLSATLPRAPRSLCSCWELSVWSSKMHFLSETSFCVVWHFSGHKRGIPPSPSTALRKCRIKFGIVKNHFSIYSGFLRTWPFSSLGARLLFVCSLL